MKEKKRVYDGIAFLFVNHHSRGASAERLSKIPAQNSQFQCPVTWSTIVVESHCESSMLFSMVYLMVNQKFAFQLCRE